MKLKNIFSKNKKDKGLSGDRPAPAPEIAAATQEYTGLKEALDAADPDGPTRVFVAPKPAIPKRSEPRLEPGVIEALPKGKGKKPRLRAGKKPTPPKPPKPGKSGKTLAERLRRAKPLSRRGKILLALNIFLLMLFLLCLGRWQHHSQLLLSQQAAARWAGESEERFAQASCFLPVNSTVSQEDILAFRKKLDAKYLEISQEAGENQKLYQDAWSATAELSVAGEYGNATVQAIGVGGNYFFFHPLRLRSGSYFSEGDFMQDRVVLDEELAWRLYGGVDLAGLTVTVNNKPYVIAGVISREADRLSARTVNPLPTLYLPFTDLAAVAETGVTCYELVGPDPITGFVSGALKDHFPLGDGELLENSARFRLEPMIKTLWHFSERTLKTTGVAYPYFENAARLAENQLALLLVCMALLLIPPLVSLVWLIIRGWQRLKAYIRGRRVNYEDM